MSLNRTATTGEATDPQTVMARLPILTTHKTSIDHVLMEFIEDNVQEDEEMMSEIISVLENNKIKSHKAFSALKQNHLDELTI